nr:hypothetical protein [Amycolatopsis sp. DSM 110486]
MTLVWPVGWLPRTFYETELARLQIELVDLPEAKGARSNASPSTSTPVR